MRKIKKIEDIKYKTFKEVEPYLKDVDTITPENMIKVVSIIFEVSEDYLKSKPFELTAAHYNLFLVTMSQPTDLITRFESDGIEYGFIPNFSEITTGELIDLDSLLVDRNFEGIASILYRPIVKSSKDKYTIADYKGYDEKLFENASVRFYLGFIDFFFKSYQILKNRFPTSTITK